MLPEEREYLRIFVGKNADYYISKWEELGEEKKFSWNWPAFFFGLLWFAYRKMYPHTFAMLIFNIILYIVQVKFNTAEIIIAITNLSISILIGMFGNYLYYDYAKSKVEEIKNQVQDEKKLYVELARNGGTSIATAFGVFVLYLIALSIINHSLTEVNDEDTGREKSISFRNS